MSFDYSKLAGAIREKFKTQARFAKAIGLSERSLSLKLNGKTYWQQKEIMAACNALHIDADDIPNYFFRDFVQNIEQNNESA